MSVPLMFASTKESVSTYGNSSPGPWFSTFCSGSAGTSTPSQWWKHIKASEKKSLVAFIDGRVSAGLMAGQLAANSLSTQQKCQWWMRTRGGTNRLHVAEQTHFGRRDEERRSRISQGEPKNQSDKTCWKVLYWSLDKLAMRRRIRAAYILK